MALIPNRIGSVALGVEDLDRSVTFYRDTLGLKLVEQTVDLAKFELENLTFTIIRRDTLLEETHLTAFGSAPFPFSLAVTVTREEVDHYMQKLADAGVTIVAPPEDKRTGPRIGFVSDPDGFIWEVLEVM
jgi:catechol 2,3-dioxygenase-like lactoylglutathione lyase family enzyme